MPLKQPRARAVTAVGLAGQDLAVIARMRAGTPPPAELLHKLVLILEAALRGERIAINLVRLP